MQAIQPPPLLPASDTPIYLCCCVCVLDAEDLLRLLQLAELQVLAIMVSLAKEIPKTEARQCGHTYLGLHVLGNQLQLLPPTVGLFLESLVSLGDFQSLIHELELGLLLVLELLQGAR